MTNRLKRFLIIFSIFIIGGTIFYYFGLHRFIQLDTIKKNEQVIRLFVNQHYAFAVFLYMAFFAIMIACSLPVVAPLTIIGGFIFGLWAIGYALLATTIGGLTAFIIIRSFIGKAGHQKYKGKLEKVKHRLQRNGVSYLLMLQFLSVVPFFIINLAAIMADFSIWTMVWTTVVGNIPFTIIYAFIGHQIACLQCVQSISWSSYFFLVVFMLLLALIPIIIRRFKGPAL